MVLFPAARFPAGRTTCGVDSVIVGAPGDSATARLGEACVREPADRLAIVWNDRDLRPGGVFLFAGFGLRADLRVRPEAEPGVSALATTGFDCVAPILVFCGIS